MKKTFFKSRLSLFLLMLSFLIGVAPISRQVLCIDADGSSSVETVHFSHCKLTLSDTAHAQVSETINTTHDSDCGDCTDISLSETHLNRLISNNTTLKYVDYIADFNLLSSLYTYDIVVVVESTEIAFVEPEFVYHPPDFLESVVLLI